LYKKYTTNVPREVYYGNVAIAPCCESFGIGVLLLLFFVLYAERLCQRYQFVLNSCLS